MSEAAAARGAGSSRLRGAAAPERTAFLAPALGPWWRGMMALLVAAFAFALAMPALGLSSLFFLFHDLPVALAMLAAAQALYLARPAWAPGASLTLSWRATGLMALGVVALCWAGTFLVYENYALSMDEFLARFDAEILASGRLAAPIPPAWRDYASILQPMFMTEDAAHSVWISNYLPVNAAFLALAGKLGAQSLMPPLWAGISVVAVFGVARRMWPQSPRTAWAAAALLATSSQLVITGMTPYAMSAHLALNLCWLWLVLRGGRLGHGAAAGVAFLATGLHQLIFHPLFAAPFVLETWLARRWKPALWHTCAYAAIGLFWLIYPGLRLPAPAMGPALAAAPMTGNGALAQAMALLGEFRPLTGLGFMVENLVRFVSWQSLLAAPLAMIAMVPALRARGEVRALAVGLILTALAVYILLPYQGHGWGYRYLHGLIGSVALLAAWSWTRVTETAEPRVRAAVFAAAAAASLLVFLPIRAWQAHALVHDHAEALREVRALDADVVLVARNHGDLDIVSVRNDPFLANRPKLMFAPKMTPGQARALCGRSGVMWVDGAQSGFARGPGCPPPALTADVPASETLGTSFP